MIHCYEIDLVNHPHFRSDDLTNIVGKSMILCLSIIRFAILHMPGKLMNEEKLLVFHITGTALDEIRINNNNF